MTERELSERLSALADKIEEIAEELKNLSNEKYVPGSVSWDDVKNQTKPPTKRMPF